MPPFLPWGLETCCDPGPPAFPAHPLPRSSLLTSPRPRSSGQLTRPFPPQGLWSGSFSPIQPQLKHHREEKHPLSIFSKTPLPWLRLGLSAFTVGPCVPALMRELTHCKPCGTARKHHCSPRLCISLPVRSQPQPAGTVLADALMCSQRDSSTRRSTCEWEAGTAL